MSFRLWLILPLTCVIALGVTWSGAAPQPRPIPAGNHFVWRVKDVAVPFYLVGSIHNLTPRDYPLPPAYSIALTNANRILFEYDPRQREALGRKFREIATYPAGKDIESDLSPNMVGLLKKNLWRFGTRFDSIRHYRPWAIALRLLATQGAVGPSSAGSMDAYLSRQAQRAGKELAGLETVDEHVAFWKELVEVDGENLLRYVLTREKRVGTLFDRTRTAWKRGDVEAFSATNARLREANPTVAQKLLDRRNQTWTARIEAEMRTGKPTAIVAGAGHFSGPHSVIALLRARGYHIARL